LGTTFAALSDPTRRAMIERLSHGPASVHGLTEPFALSQQMISKQYCPEDDDGSLPNRLKGNGLAVI